MKKKTARRHNYSLIAGLILTGLLVAVILIGTIWTPYDPNAMSAGEKLLAPLRRRIEKETFRGDTNTELVLASLGNDAGLVGAAML